MEPLKIFVTCRFRLCWIIEKNFLWALHIGTRVLARQKKWVTVPVSFCCTKRWLCTLVRIFSELVPVLFSIRYRHRGSSKVSDGNGIFFLIPYCTKKFFNEKIPVLCCLFIFSADVICVVSISSASTGTGVCNGPCRLPIFTADWRNIFPRYSSPVPIRTVAKSDPVGGNFLVSVYFFKKLRRDPDMLDHALWIRHGSVWTNGPRKTGALTNRTTMFVMNTGRVRTGNPPLPQSASPSGSGSDPWSLACPFRVFVCIEAVFFKWTFFQYIFPDIKWIVQFGLIFPLKLA